MPLDSLKKWISGFGGLPLEANNAWVNNFIGWLTDHLRGMTLRLEGPPALFNYNPEPLRIQMMSFTPINSPVIAANRLASAWATSMVASTMVVTPGASIGAPGPATTWSIVAGPAIIELPSVELAKNLLAQKIATSRAVGDPEQSPIPGAFLEACGMLTYTVSGMNSIVPTPTPLIVPSVLVR